MNSSLSGATQVLIKAQNVYWSVLRVRGSGQVEKNPKTREKIGLSRTHPPTHPPPYTIFQFFGETCTITNNNTKKRKNTIFGIFWTWRYPLKLLNERHIKQGWKYKAHTANLILYMPLSGIYRDLTLAQSNLSELDTWESGPEGPMKKYCSSRFI